MDLPLRRRVWAHPSGVVPTVVALIATLAVASASGGTVITRPEAPQSVHAIAGDGFVNVSWTRPAHDGGSAITRYVVTSIPKKETCVTTATMSNSCTLWGMENGVRYEFTVAARNRVGLGSPSMMSNAVAPRDTLRVLPTCNWYVVLPTMPVTQSVLAVVTSYYAARHLTPVSVFQNLETVLSVQEEYVGVHRCNTVGNGLRSYGGGAPLNATAAIRVLVEHKPDALGYSAHFLTIAKIPKVGWKVVGEGTGP